MKFCIECGAALEEEDGELLSCMNCGADGDEASADDDEDFWDDGSDEDDFEDEDEDDDPWG